MQLKTLCRLAMLLILIFTVGRSIRATTLDYLYHDLGGNTFEWFQDSSPIPPVSSDGCCFFIFPIGVSENGATAQPGEVDFFEAGNLGGAFVLIVNDATVANPTGPQLYTGPETSPTMLIGTFTLFPGTVTPFASIEGSQTLTTTLTVTPVSNVPEASTRTSLLAGFSLLLLAMLVQKTELLKW